MYQQGTKTSKIKDPTLFFSLNESDGVCGGRRRTPAAFSGNSRMRDDDDEGGGEIRV